MEAAVTDFGLRGLATELSQKLLAVPFYQRSYAWGPEEVGEFWSDLNQAFGAGAAAYFIGTLVLTQEGSPPRDTIIDGQQRLATTAILLAAIRDEYKEKNDAARGNIVQNTYLSSDDLQTAQKVARLNLNSDDHFFFEQRIVLGLSDPPPTRPSHTLILNSYQTLRSNVSKAALAAADAWPDTLLQWTEFLKNKVIAIVIQVPNEADAFLIFETLNDRGADLTIADLLKNYLFGRAGQARLNAVRDSWRLVLGSLGITAENQLFTAFLRHYWSSMNGAVRERELYKSIKEQVTTSTQVQKFVDDLTTAATLYSAITSSDHQFWDAHGTSARQNVERLLRLNLEQNRPLLLAALQHFSAGEIKRLLKALVSWSVRGLIVGGIGGGATETAYCRAAVKIRKGEISRTSQLRTELAARIPTDEEFKSAFAIARVSRGALARYYLLSLEREVTGVSEPELVPNNDEDEVNLEHVLPQSATDADWGANFPADERADWYPRLGNMVLLKKGPNARLGNKSFNTKKPVLKQSQLTLTSEVGNENDWTKEAIGKRQVKMASLAAKTWRR